MIGAINKRFKEMVTNSISGLGTGCLDGEVKHQVET